jgi:hypothetical protein
MDSVKKEVHKIAKGIKTTTEDKLVDRFEKGLDEWEDAVRTKYEELNGVVTDRESKSRPEEYMDKFFTELREESSIQNIEGEGIVLEVPNMETFDFSGMEPLQHIVEGTPGKYVEMNTEDYDNVFGNKYKSETLINPEAVSKYRVYLVPYSNKVRQYEKANGKRFVIFPFSNMAPFNLFEEGEVFLNENVGKWVGDSIKTAMKKVAGK